MDLAWHLQGWTFTNCNCAYGCPCQFNALPTHGKCEAVVGIMVEEGHHGETKLDGLRFGGVFAWPGAIHEGRGQAVPIIDERASPAQRDSLLRIMSGQDTEPGATVFQVFSSTFEKLHDPIFTRLDLDIDVEARTARFDAPGVVEARGEPIRNPVTNEQHRARIDLPAGFEYVLAEVGRGWAKAKGAIQLDLSDSHAHFARLDMTGAGVVR